MEEESSPTRRGRPRGTGIDDTPILAAVADVLLASPGMLPTTAMKRAVRGVQPTQLRRLQEKWKVHGNRFRAEAGERVRQKEEAAARAAAAGAAAVAPDPAAAWRAAAGMVDQAGVAAMLAGIDSPAMEAMHLEHASMAATMSRQLGNLGRIKKLVDMVDPPALRALRQAVEPPALRQIRALQATLDRLDPLRRRR